MNIQKLLAHIEKYDIVSFDIFDTLLKRDVFRPSDVFSIVEHEYYVKYGENNQFKTKRICAEKQAREKSVYSDITLDEIYEEIDIPNKQLYQSIELEIESSLLRCNDPIKYIYDKCLVDGKTIYIVSDMYLPKTFLEKVLHREGYTGFKALFLSCDYRETKRSGELYKALCNVENVNPEKILHIGDSRYADYIGARKAGLKARHIKRSVNNTIYSTVPNDKTDICARTLFSFINNRLPLIENRAEKIGYEVLGPIIYAYCAWIHKRYQERCDSNTRLWFAARDMYLFADAYKKIYGSENDLQYIYISRNSLRPILTQVTGDMTESGSVFARGEITLEEIIKKMGYSLEDIDQREIIQSNKKYNVRHLDDYPEVLKVLSSPRILDKERELAQYGMRYLEEQGLFDNIVFLADVGWHGTTQYVLERIQRASGKEGSIIGLYIGCLDGTNDKIGKDNYFFFSFNEDKEADFGKGILVFESLILAPHGSTKRYQIQDNMCIPVLGKPDNVSSFLHMVQTGAMRFVEDFSQSVLSRVISIDANTATKAFCKLVMEPQKEEICSIGDLDYENFGVEKMAAPKNIAHYIRYPREFLRDLKYSPWRVGFLYRLCKIRLPYAKIYTIVRKKQGKMT